MLALDNPCRFSRHHYYEFFGKARFFIQPLALAIGSVLCSYNYADSHCSDAPAGWPPKDTKVIRAGETKNNPSGIKIYPTSDNGYFYSKVDGGTFINEGTVSGITGRNNDNEMISADAGSKVTNADGGVIQTVDNPTKPSATLAIKVKGNGSLVENKGILKVQGKRPTSTQAISAPTGIHAHAQKTDIGNTHVINTKIYKEPLDMLKPNNLPPERNGRRYTRCLVVIITIHHQPPVSDIQLWRQSA